EGRLRHRARRGAARTTQVSTGRGYDPVVAVPAIPLPLRLLGLYPKKLGSSFVGLGANATIPPALRRKLIGGFAARFGADVSEAEKPIEEYRSILDFFTRRLKPGLRPQAP